MAFVYVCILLAVWYIAWRPGMVDWFKNRKTIDAGMKQLNDIKYIEDVLRKKWRDK